MFIQRLAASEKTHRSFIKISLLLALSSCFLVILGSLYAADQKGKKRSEFSNRRGPLYGKRVTIQSLDLSRTPTDEELKMSGQLSGPLSPEPQMESAALEKISSTDRKQRKAADNLLVGQAMEKWNAHHYGEAVALFRQHRKTFSNSQWAGEAELHIGADAQANGRWNEAVFSYDWVINNAPKGSEVYQKAKMRRSIVHMLQGEINKSLQSFADMLADEKDWNRVTYAQSWILRLSQLKKQMKSVRTCGSQSVAYILKKQGKKKQAEKALLAQAKTEEGFSLGQLMEFASQTGLKASSASVQLGDLSKLPVPFIAHYRDLHYVVVEKISDNNVQVFDPRLKLPVIMSVDQFSQLWSGLIIIIGNRPAGIRSATEEQLASAMGGCCNNVEPTSNLGRKKCPPPGLPEWEVNEINMNLNVGDMPLWYSNPYGPPIRIILSYNSQAALSEMNPFGNKWSFNYCSYATVNANGAVSVTMPDGAVDIYTPDGSDGYTAPPRVNNKLVKLSGDYFYDLQLTDNTIYHYGIPSSMPGGTTSLLLAIEDQFGNTVTLSYNSQGQLTVITDPLRRDNTVSYNAQGLISRIDDPFGRFCTFSYDTSGNLVGQTDMAGISYSYGYGIQGTDINGRPQDYPNNNRGNYLTSITTPNGTTQFYTEPSDSISYGNHDFYPVAGAVMQESYRITITHPDSNKEEYFYNGYTNQGNSWHRDRQQYKLAPITYSSGYLDVFTLPRTVYDLSTPSQGVGRVTSVHYADGRAVWYSYDGDLNWTGKGDEVGHWTERAYNDRGRLTTFTDAKQNTITIQYATNNLDATNIINQLGNSVTQVTYGPQRQITSVTDGAGNKMGYGYNEHGQLTSMTNAMGKPEQQVTSLEYVSTTGLLRKVKRENATLANYTYDTIGRVSSVTDANGYTLRFAYDGLNRLIRVTYPDGTTERRIWSAYTLDKVIDRAGRVTAFTYDKANYLSRVQDPAGRMTQYYRDAVGNLTTLIDGNGNATKFTYDRRYRVTGKTYADGRSQSYAYDEVGNLTYFTNGISATSTNGVVTRYAYDANDNLTDATYSTAVTPNVHFEYNAANQRTSMRTGQDTTTYSYNLVGRLTGVDGPLQGDEIVYSYDSLKRQTGRTINGTENSVSIQYDAIGRVSTVSNPLGAFSYQYKPNGTRLTQVNLPNGVKTTYSYLADSGDQRLAEILHQTTGGATLSKFDYTYDTAGQIRQWTQQADNGAPVRYDLGYDNADELVKATLVNTVTSATVKDFAYTYDKGDNRTGEQIDSIPQGANYNSVNQLISRTNSGPLQVTGTVSEPASVSVSEKAVAINAGRKFETSISAVTGTNTFTVSARDYSGNARTNVFQVVVPPGATADTFTYDDRGNMLTGNGRTYTWDDADRLKTITYSDNTSTEFTYDGYGRRIKIVEKDASGTVTSTKQFVWDGLQIAEERDDSNTVTKRFYPQGEKIGSTAYYYTRDHLGSIRELTDSSGAVQARYDYDPFGRLTKIFGTVESDFAYTGHYYHAKSGLALAPYRAYDPDLGRWLSRDPIAENGGINLYAYVKNEPIRWIDLLGLSEKDVGRIKSIYKQSIKDMMSDGSRWTDGLLNNVPSWWDPKIKTCVEQTQQVLDDLKKNFTNPDDTWTFSLVESYDILGIPVHNSALATSSNPNDPAIHMDPLNNSLNTTNP